MDISNFITWFLGQLVYLVTYFFSWLDNIHFLGTSLLRFSILVFVMGAIIDVMFSVVKSNAIREMRPRKKVKENKGD